jgi:hypothetical protein
MIRRGTEYTLHRMRIKTAPVTFQYRKYHLLIPVGFSGIGDRLVTSFGTHFPYFYALK